MKLSRYEQERLQTTMQGNRTTVYTRDKAVMRKLNMLVANFPDTYSLMEQDEVSKTYSFPKSYISYRKPKAISADRREQAWQMMLEINAEISNQK